MMKYLALMAGTLCMFGANADPRIEVNANNTFCHILNGNPDNADDETFDGGCINFIAANGGGADGHGFSVHDGVPAAAVPHVFANGVEVLTGHCPPGQAKKGNCAAFQKSKWVVQMDQDDFNGLECAMVETNGTTYEAAQWTTTIHYAEGRLTHDIVCLNGKVAE